MKNKSIWTKKDIEFLIANYDSMRNIEISSHINKKLHAVNHKARCLRLHKPKDFLSKIYSGTGNPFYGKKHTKENLIIITKSNRRKNPKLSITKKRLFNEGKLTPPVKKGMTYDEQFGKEKSKIFRANMSKNHADISGKKNPMYGKKHTDSTKLKQRNKALLRWDNEEYVTKALNSFNMKPNSKELLLMRLMKEHSFPFNYIGDGKFWIRYRKSSFNPDFMSDDKSMIIEFFGDYWHTIDKERILRDKKRLRAYSHYGYRTLVIWQSELVDINSVINKIRNFVDYGNN